MNTEKLEKLKKSLDNKFVPDSMKDKIRTEIEKLESEIKDKEVTPTEIKEEIKNIEVKVEDALEVAEKKEEKQEESKPKTTKKATTGTKKTAMALAKEIRKEGESWKDAVSRASKEMKGVKEEVKKETKSEIDKLKSLIRKRKDLQGVSSSNLMRDGHRKALPSGKRTSASGNTYYENRRNRTDKGKVGSLYLAKGGGTMAKEKSFYQSLPEYKGYQWVGFWDGYHHFTKKEDKGYLDIKVTDKDIESGNYKDMIDYGYSYANGGAIPNNYEGKTPKQVWNNWTEKQRKHFLHDHEDEFPKYLQMQYESYNLSKEDFDNCPLAIKQILTSHVNAGQYADGGFMDGVYKKGGEITFEHSNLRIVGTGMDVNGNRIVKVAFPNQRAFSIQTNGTLPYTHRLLRNFNTQEVDLDYTEIQKMEDEIVDYVENYGSDKQKKSLRVYGKFENGGDFLSGAYAEEGAEIDNWEKYQIQDKNGYVSYFDDKNYAEKFLKENEGSTIVRWDDDKETIYTRNKDGIRVKSVAMPQDRLTEAKWLAKHNESPEARSYAEGGNLPSWLKDKESVMFEKGKNVVIDERNYNESLGMSTLYDVYVNGLKIGKVQYDVEHKDFTAFSSKGFTGGVRFSQKEFENKDEAIKYIVDNAPKSFAVGGGIFADTFTGTTGTHYTGLVGETNAMSSGEMFMSGGRVRRTKAQMTKDRENKEIDAYNWYVVDLETNRAITGNEYKEDAIDVLSDYDDKKRYKVVSKKTLKSLGIENPNESWKSYADGGAIANQQLIADAHLRPAEMFGREGIPAYNEGGNINTNTNNKMKKRLEKGDDVLIIGRRWFDRVNGNTYHTAEVQVNGEFIGKSKMTYGYDEQYLETGKEILLDHYELPVGMTERSPLWQLRDYGVVLHKYAIDGLKRELAHGGGVTTHNGREYSTGRNWTNDHNHVNKGEEHEVSYKRKKSSFNNGGLMDIDNGAGYMNDVYAGGGKVSPFKNMMETNTITEKEINLIKMRMNNKKVDEYTQEAIDYIWDNSPRLTPDQDKKGIDYLRNLWKSPTGKERANNPFGYREQDTLETFEYFELRGFYDAGNYHHKFYVPLYTCVGKDSNFEYYISGGSINIVG